MRKSQGVAHKTARQGYLSSRAEDPGMGGLTNYRPLFDSLQIT